MFELRDAGQTAKLLRSFCETLRVAARRLATLPELIPPPSPMRDALENWRTLATVLEGRLETARMALVGEHNGRAAEVTTEWTRTGDPLATWVRLSARVPERRTGEWLRAPGPSSHGDELATEPPEPARRLIADSAHRLDAVVVKTDGVSAALPAPLCDPRPALDVLHDLEVLATRLEKRSGPYR